jgi:hypothetical protein
VGFLYALLLLHLSNHKNPLKNEQKQQNSQRALTKATIADDITTCRFYLERKAMTEKSKESKTKSKKTLTNEVFAYASGIRYYEDIPKQSYRLKADGSFYIGDGMSVMPDGTFIDTPSR